MEPDISSKELSIYLKFPKSEHTFVNLK